MTAQTIKDYADEWENLPWNLFQKELFRLQHRIYEASKKGDKSLIKKLQNLLLSSQSSQYLAVRDILQSNLKKKSIGTDNVVDITANYYFLLVQNLKLIRLSEKSNRNIFGDVDKKIYWNLSNLQNRCIQRLVKYALEPVYQSDSSKIYSSVEIQKIISNKLLLSRNSNIEDVFVINIENCFSKVNYEKLISLIILPKNVKKILFSSFRMRLLEKKWLNLQLMNENTQIIFPLLHEILLDGCENIINQSLCFTRNPYIYNGIRYGKSIIFIVHDCESRIKLINKLELFLSERGLDVEKMEKHFLCSQVGFDFLDWHFVVNNKSNKLICHPSKTNLQELVRKIKKTLKNSKYKLLKRLEISKRIYYNWSIYHQYCDMSQVNATLWSIKNWSYKYLKKSSNMSKQERSYYVQMIFSKTKYFISQYSAN